MRKQISTTLTLIWVALKRKGSIMEIRVFTDIDQFAHDENFVRPIDVAGAILSLLRLII